MTEQPAQKPSKSETLRLPCKNCDGETVHKILEEVTRHDGDENIDVYSQYQIVECGGCEEVSFRKNSQCSEDMDYDSVTGEPYLVDNPELFPSRIAGRREIKSVEILPLKIQSLYRETHHALCYKLGILAGIGIRGLVEALCKEKKAAGGNLEKKIDSLVDLGILTKAGSEILHGTRLLGNVAAHEAEPVPEKQLDAAMDVVEHLLTGVFILPKKADGLPKRSKKKRAGG